MVSKKNKKKENASHWVSEWLSEVKEGENLELLKNLKTSSILQFWVTETGSNKVYKEKDRIE